MKEIRPNYYKLNGKDDLFTLFENGLMSESETRGFYKGNIFKYIKRYREKNGMKDLLEAQTYVNQLVRFEHNLENEGD